MKTTQIFGLHPVIEAIEAGRTIDKIFVQKIKYIVVLKKV